MALPGSGAITSDQVLAELGRAGPLSFTDSDVRTLIGVPSGPVVFPTNFYGKSSVTLSGDWGNISAPEQQILDQNYQYAYSVWTGYNYEVTPGAGTIVVSWSDVTWDNNSGYLAAYISGVGGTSANNGASINVTEGQTVYFAWSSFAYVYLSPPNFTATLTNASGGATIDTFTVTG